MPGIRNSEEHRALLVAPDEDQAGPISTDLERAGYDVVTFESCAVALDWLDEETPQVAVIQVEDDPLGAKLVRELLHRHVETVLDGQPLG